MRLPKIGIIGLGSIAQKAYLPLLSVEHRWQLIGAYSPTKSKREELCRQYRMQSFSDIPSLLSSCDIVFVHPATDTHYEIVQTALAQGKDVYVDKPLAATLEQAERLAELSKKTNRKLMVGFNRRFAPFYVEAKQKIQEVGWIRMEKHRINGLYPDDKYDFTLLDDYIHVVDTARWLGADTIATGSIVTTENDKLVYALHAWNADNYTVTTAMHRKAGTNLEQLEVVSKGSIIRVKNLEMLEVEVDGIIKVKSSPSWDTILKRRGFEGAVHHFIDCLIGDQEPMVNGWEALQTQICVHKMIKMK